MPKKELVLSLLLVMLGLASLDALLDHKDYMVSIPGQEEGQVRISGDGTPSWPQ